MEERYVFNIEDGRMTVGSCGFTIETDGVGSAKKVFCDNDGLSVPFMKVIAVENGEEREYNIWNDLPVVEMPMYRGEFTYPVSGNNYTLRVVRLYAVTDYHDNFVSENEVYMYRGKIGRQQGNIFFLDDPLTKETLVFISTAPDYAKVMLELGEGKVKIDTCGHGIVAGRCKKADSEALVRAWYRRKCKPTYLYTMANTWGDCNAFYRVADDFIKGEIEGAALLGLDTLQIDDGWQKGNTSDPTIKNERNRRLFKGDFWELKKEKFRKGMEEMRDYAAEKGISLGLWFAPDSDNCYERLERDISVLENAYKNWDMRYFKLDMLYVDDMAMYRRFEEMLRKIYSLGEGVFVQLDVTNGVRNGYLGVTQYGRIFAENRYTKLRTYYPHRTLQNLWNICKYIPAFKFQFELVNPTLNADCYSEDDVFAPSFCDMDYLFAITMMSNPLFWMEVQFVPEEQRKQLDRIMPVWKSIRGELANCDVVPVGERPDGVAFTGFAAYTPDRSRAYLLAFREVNEEEAYTFTLEKEIKNAEILATNGNVEYNANGKSVEVSFEKMRAYALIALDLK